MATTKKSTKAKTKTLAPKTRKSLAAKTKKPVIKTTKAARTVKKSVSTKAVKDTTVKKTAVNIKSRGKTSVLQRLQFISGLVTLGLAVAAGLLMSTKAYQLFTGLLTKDELASQTTTVFAPALHSVYDIELRWTVVAILGLSTLMSLLLMTRLKRQYRAGLQNNVHMWRWIDLAVVNALMVEIIALLSGVQDIMTLKLIGGVVAVSALLGWVAEKQNANVQKPVRSAFVLSVITGLLPWLLIGTYAVSTYVYGMVRSPWYVYALYAVGFVSFIAYVLNIRSQLRMTRPGINYEKVERNYLVINLLTRATFAIVLIIGLKK